MPGTEIYSTIVKTVYILRGHVLTTVLDVAMTMMLFSVFLTILKHVFLLSPA